MLDILTNYLFITLLIFPSCTISFNPGGVVEYHGCNYTLFRWYYIMLFCCLTTTTCNIILSWRFHLVSWRTSYNTKDWINSFNNFAIFNSLPNFTKWPVSYNRDITFQITAFHFSNHFSYFKSLVLAGCENNQIQAKSFVPSRAFTLDD